MSEEKVYYPYRNIVGLYVIFLVLFVLLIIECFFLWNNLQFMLVSTVFVALLGLCCLQVYYLRSIKIRINGEGLYISHRFSKKETWVSFAEFSHARYVRTIKGHNYLLLSRNPIPKKITRIFSRTSFALDMGNIQPTKEGYYCVYLQYAPDEVIQVIERRFFEK